MTDSQQYCLRWNNHQSNLQRVFARLLRSQTFTDVTLACEGRSLQAHKLVLSACSVYFEQLFTVHPDKAPLVILKDVKFADMKAIVDFMYIGEINVAQDQLSSLLSTALVLKVKGLADVSADGGKDGAPGVGDTPQPSRPSSPPSRRSAPPSAGGQSVDSGSLSDGGAVEEKNPTSVVSAGSILAAAVASASSPAGSDSAVPESSLSSDLLLKLNSSVSEQSASLQSTVKGLFAGVLKLEEYVASNGGRDGFWQSSGVVRVMSAIRERLIDLKTGSELLGVPYSTIYGRYREHHQPVTAETPDAASPAKTPSVKMEGVGESGIIYPVVQLNEHVQSGALRHAFWELPSTRSVLDAIFNRLVEMKTGAEMLGVSYGTLYGRYRENYGYLKSTGSSNKQSGKKASVSGVSGVPGMWEDSMTADTLARVSSGQLSVQHAAELLGIDYYVLKYQLTLMEAAAAAAGSADTGPDSKRPRTEHTNGAQTDDVIEQDVDEQ